MPSDPFPQLDPAFEQEFPPPRPTGLIGMWLFLAALGMLFASGLLGYVVVRMSRPLAGVAVHLPRSLWLSTALILASSFTIHRAVRALDRPRQAGLRGWLLATLVLAAAFVAVQGPSLWILLREHAAQRRHGLAIYGLIFFLVLLHALHVLGGMIALVRLNLGARGNRYGQENRDPVRYAALYWHFLDVVWIIMFTVMSAAG